ncbi:copper-binding protein [Bradyrhizobium sp. 139]|uniref:copper-binding protein n=1 Tax=Bradyrhizobium sp. 139 TaxID=2782616 RepID=UPI001FFA3682|nr:copper-binding protein [Bradyrhizobium sp. 139]
MVFASLCGPSAFADSASATGQLTKVDADAGKVTIKHGPIKALDMPDPMTMVYRVKDPAALRALKAGDNVKFDVDHETSGYIVTRIERQ